MFRVRIPGDNVASSTAEQWSYLDVNKHAQYLLGNTMETKTEKVYRIHLDNPKYRLGDKKAGGQAIAALLKDYFETLSEQHDFIDWPSLSIEKDKYKPYILVVKVLCYDFNGEMIN